MKRTVATILSDTLEQELAFTREDSFFHWVIVPIANLPLLGTLAFGIYHPGPSLIFFGLLIISGIFSFFTMNAHLRKKAGKRFGKLNGHFFKPWYNSIPKHNSIDAYFATKLKQKTACSNEERLEAAEYLVEQSPKRNYKNYLLELGFLALIWNIPIKNGYEMLPPMQQLNVAFWLTVVFSIMYFIGKFLINDLIATFDTKHSQAKRIQRLVKFSVTEKSDKT